MFAGRIKHSKFSNELFVLFFQSINVLLELCYLPLWVMRQLGLLRGEKGIKQRQNDNSNNRYQLHVTKCFHSPVNNTRFRS